MSKKAKIWITIIICSIIAVLLLLNVGVGIVDNSKVTVVFDKLPMMLADRLVIQYDNNTYEVTDLSLIRQITRETVVADRTTIFDMYCGKLQIEVYCGNTLIRKMYQAQTQEWGELTLYRCGPSRIHYVLFHPYDNCNVTLSNDVLLQLKNIIESGQTS